MNHRAMFTVAVLAVVLLGVGVSAGADASGYRAAGSPPDPKVEVRWNRYYDHAEATELIHQMAEAYPELVSVESLGESHEGRELWLMTITDPDAGEPGTKPGFWIDGAIHGNELQATETVLYTAWYLLEMQGHNAFITQLLKDRTFYLMPMMSPDARDHHMHHPNTTHTPRTGMVGFDDVEGNPMGFDDLDGDGHITQMRVRDPDGRYVPHPEYPNLMVRARADERGEYRLLGWERRLAEDADQEDLRRRAYDPNRDWPWQWQPSYVQQGAFRYPFSVPANRAVAEFLLSRRNIAGAQSYHNTGGMILRGPGAPGDAYSREDLRVFDTIGERGEMILPGYDYLELRSDLYPGYGVELDYFYAMRGAIAYTNELFTTFNLFREETPGLFGSDEELHKFDRYLLMGEGITPWQEVEHPDLGTIEVGGLKSNWLRQPPSFLLEEEAHRSMAFTLYHADQMPLVRVRDVQVEDLGGGLMQVTASFANDRLQPTRLGIDVQREITPPDRAQLIGEDVEVVTAMVADEPYFREAREQTYQMDDVRIERIGGLDAVHVRWIVRGDVAGATVRIQSHKGGSGEMVIGD
ncbi:MAG: M14 family metallopeptidase [Phycisphaeraceae bacterium]